MKPFPLVGVCKETSKSIIVLAKRCESSFANVGFLTTKSLAISAALDSGFSEDKAVQSSSLSTINTSLVLGLATTEPNREKNPPDTYADIARLYEFGLWGYGEFHTSETMVPQIWGI